MRKDWPLMTKFEVQLIGNHATHSYVHTHSHTQTYTHVLSSCGHSTEHYGYARVASGVHLLSLLPCSGYRSSLQRHSWWESLLLSVPGPSPHAACSDPLALPLSLSTSGQSIAYLCTSTHSLPHLTGLRAPDHNLCLIYAQLCCEATCLFVLFMWELPTRH